MHVRHQQQLAACCLWLLLGGVVNAADGESRAWRDVAGKFEIRAVLLKVEGDRVQIRREDGRVFDVPLANLSPEDRQYVAGLAKSGAEAKPAGNPARENRPAAADVLVIIRQEIEGNQILLPGIVFARVGDKAYIAAPNQMESLNPDFLRLGPATVLWGARGEHNGIPARRLCLLRQPQRAIYEAAADKLPAPLPIAKVTEKEPVAVRAEKGISPIIREVSGRVGVSRDSEEPSSEVGVDRLRLTASPLGVAGPWLARAAHSRPDAPIFRSWAEISRSKAG